MAKLSNKKENHNVMTAEQFHPRFNYDVAVQVPLARQSSAVHPKECLKEDSAKELAELLKEQGFQCRIFQGHPHGLEQGRTDAASTTVPWFQFFDGEDGAPGTRINAGLIADYWVHQTPNIALRYAILEIKYESRRQGFNTF
jgi:hypothetical protein